MIALYAWENRMSHIRIVEIMATWIRRKWKKIWKLWWKQSMHTGICQKCAFTDL